MGLPSAIKSRFFPPELCRVAKRGDMAAIAECIARTRVVVIGGDIGDSVPFDADEQSILIMVETALQKNSFEGSIHKYEFEGDTYLPLFTSPAAGELFCGAYCSLLGRIHAFRLFSLPGAYLRHWITDQDIIVVNPQNDSEVKIDRGKSSAICEGLPEWDTFDDAQLDSLCLPMAGIQRPIELLPDTQQQP